MEQLWVESLNTPASVELDAKAPEGITPAVTLPGVATIAPPQAPIPVVVFHVTPRRSSQDSQPSDRSGLELNELLDSHGSTELLTRARETLQHPQRETGNAA